MSYLDGLLAGYRIIQDGGVPLPTRPTINVVGATFADNPTQNRTDMTLGAFPLGLVAPSLDSLGNLALGAVTATSITIGRVGFTTTVAGNLVVDGTTLSGTVLDVEDRVVHVNYSAGANDPVPVAIAGISVHRGAVAGVDRDHAGLFWQEATGFRFAYNTGGDDSTVGANVNIVALGATFSGLTASRAVVTDGSSVLTTLVYTSAATNNAIVQRDGSAGAAFSGITAISFDNVAALQIGTANTPGITIGRAGIVVAMDEDVTITGGLQVQGLTINQVVRTDASSTLDTLNYTSTSTASALVQRDASGDFAARDLTLRNVTMTGVLSNAAGAAATPSYTFTGDTDSGLYSAGANSVALGVGGAAVVTVSATAVTSTMPLLAPAGAVGAPSHSYSGDTDSGWYSVGANSIGAAVGGALVLTVAAASITAAQVVLGPAGAVGAPSFAFSGDTDTGLYSVGANSIGVSAGGAVVLTVAAASVTVGQVALGNNGGASGPAWSFSGDTNTGMFNVGADVLGFSTGGTNRLSISNTAVSIAQAVATTGNPTALTVTPAAHTTLTASGECIDVSFPLARTVQHATGAIVTQRAIAITAPTYGFVGASTITTSATVAVSGPPVAGTNATQTTAFGLLAQIGAVGAGTTTAASVGIAGAPTGATTNYAFWVQAGAVRFDGTTIGFFNTAPVVQQTRGATLTNNVTVGGVNDTIADFAGALYATDASTIRDDIYQLSRIQQQHDVALRALGLLT